MALLLHRNRLAKIDGAAALADVIPVPGGNLHDYIARYDGLAAKPGMQSLAWRHVQPVLFFLIHLGEVVISFFDDHVAGGAGTYATAGVLQINSTIFRHIQQRFRLAMTLIGHLPGVELECHVSGEKRNFGHFIIIPFPLDHPIVYRIIRDRI